MLSEISQTRKRTNSVGFHLHAAPDAKLMEEEDEHRENASEPVPIYRGSRGERREARRKACGS